MARLINRGASSKILGTVAAEARRASIVNSSGDREALAPGMTSSSLANSLKKADRGGEDVILRGYMCFQRAERFLCRAGVRHAAPAVRVSALSERWPAAASENCFWRGAWAREAQYRARVWEQSARQSRPSVFLIIFQPARGWSGDASFRPASVRKEVFGAILADRRGPNTKL